MTTLHDERHQLNQKHLVDPQVGDYWNDMFMPVCVVLGRTEGGVVICKTTKDTDPSHWTWDLAKFETMSLEAFAAWLSYKTENMKHLTWASVAPRAHAWAREAAKEVVFGRETVKESA